MIDEGNADVRADPVVGGDLQGGWRRRELKLEGRGGIASMPQGTGVGDLDFEFLDGFHLGFFSEEKRSLPRVQGLESEDSTGWVKRGEEGGGVDLWEDADSTEIGHEFEKGKEEFGEPVGVSFSSLDSKVAVEEFDGEEEFGSGFGG